MRKWFSAGLALCLATVNGPSPSAIAAPAAPVRSTLTAEELLKAGNAAYQTGDWNKAESLLGQFLSEYGSNPQAAPALVQIKPLLAMARIRMARFPEALPIIADCLKETGLTPAQREELAFWFGICQMQAEKYEEAKSTFQKFATDYSASVRRNETLLMVGTILVVQEKFSEGADYFEKIMPALQGLDRGRAVSLLLYCFNQSGRLEEALSLVTLESARVNDILQIAGFQLLALELGSKFLEKKEYRNAVAAFQRVWNRDRVLQYQEERLQFLRNRLAALETQKADPQWTFQLSQALTKIERELKSFREMKNYDSALQLRLATAFLEMERYREAALIMERMLQTMPPDPIVEQASISLMQCWLAIERWPSVVEVYSQFETKFPNSEQLPLALFLKGQAEQSSTAYADSINTFDILVRRFPKSPLALRAMFMAGYGEILRDNFDEALQRFEKISVDFPKDPMAETTAYWSGMVLSLDKQWAAAREALDRYLRKYKEGSYVSEAVFRKAYCAQSAKDYEISIAELKAFLREYPKSSQVAEALVLLGDAYMAEGEMERGIDTYERIDPKESRYFEEGWFKIAKALRLQEKSSALRAHLLRFRAEHPESARIAEALYWIAWSYRAEDNLDKAREVYWQAIQELGDKAELFAVEDLFAGVVKLYSEEEDRKALAGKLSAMLEEARSTGKKTLTTRTLWAQATLVKKSDPERAQALLVEAASTANISTTNPWLLADFAQAAMHSAKLQEAESFYRSLLKWNPRSRYKDRALSALADIALLNRDPRTAMKYFDRFEKEVDSSPLLGKVRLARAKLLRGQGEKSQVKVILEMLLTDKQANGQLKAEALIELGEILMEEGEYGKAVAYFQRVYVMYDRWPAFVAKAYLRSGIAFEKLDDKESALKTYRELIAREELAASVEKSEAKKRIAQLEPEAAAL